MHLTRILAREIVSPLKGVSPKGKRFEDIFVFPHTKKPWDGQDKDKYFRDKYAHVHAAQKKAREEKRKVKSVSREARSFTKNKTRRHEQAIEEGRRPKKEPNAMLDTRQPKEQTFAAKVKDILDKDPRRMFLYGTGPVTAALQSRRRDLLKLYTKESERSLDTSLRDLCKSISKSFPIEYNVSSKDMNILSNNGVHNRVVLETRALATEPISALGHLDETAGTCEIDLGTPEKLQVPYSRNAHKKFPLALFLDEITDVHNVGAIVRSAYLLGVDYIIRAKRNCAELNPVVSKSSAGALECVNIYDVNHPLQFFEASVANGWNIVSSVASAGTSKGNAKVVKPSALHSLAMQGPCMLVVGSEGEGLRTSLLQRSTHVTTLASRVKSQPVDSLNVSVATALLLAQLSGAQAFD